MSGAAIRRPLLSDASQEGSSEGEEGEGRSRWGEQGEHVVLHLPHVLPTEKLHLAP